MIYFTKPSGRVKQANPVFAPPSASNWLASLAVIGLFASPAYGQVDEQVDDCSGAPRSGEIGGGCQLQYRIGNNDAIEGVTAVPAMPATYRLTIDGIVYEATGSITPDGLPDVLQLETDQAVDTDGDGSLSTVTFSYTLGAELNLEILTDGVPAVIGVTAVPETFTDAGGDDGTAVGDGAIVKGRGSVAVGNGAVVGVNVEGSGPTMAVEGQYTITINGQEYKARGTVTPGDGTPDVLTLIVPEAEGTDSDGDGSHLTVTFDDGEGDVLNLKVDVAPVTAAGPVAATIAAVEHGTAIGFESAAIGDGGVAIGSGASAAANGIAIGTRVDGDGNIVGVEAGENQIRIGSTQTDVRIGAYDLSGLTQIPQIAVNTDDIQTNRAGIASAVAMANLPSVQGPKGGWSLALGSFDGETAIAGGINFDFRQIGTIKIGVASSDGETSGGIGYGMGF